MSAWKDTERICREIVRAGDGIFDWRWDDGFETALSAITAEHQDHVMQILGRDLRAIWRAETVGRSPARVRELADKMGLHPGQMLLCTDAEEGPLLFCTWWPWQDGKTISIRIGVVTAGSVARDDLIKSWFGL